MTANKATAIGRQRPRPLRIATALWLTVGVLFVLGGLGGFAQIAAGLPDDPIILVMAPAILLLGVGLIVLSRVLKRGRDTRIALTVMGAIVTLVWAASILYLALPLVLLVLLVLLQYRPDCGRWLADARAATPGR